MSFSSCCLYDFVFGFQQFKYAKYGDIFGGGGGIVFLLGFFLAFWICGGICHSQWKCLSAIISLNIPCLVLSLPSGIILTQILGYLVLPHSSWVFYCASPPPNSSFLFQLG